MSTINSLGIKTVQIRSVCKFLWHKSSHHSLFQAEKDGQYQTIAWDFHHTDIVGVNNHKSINDSQIQENNL